MNLFLQRNVLFVFYTEKVVRNVYIFYVLWLTLWGEKEGLQEGLIKRDAVLCIIVLR